MKTFTTILLLIFLSAYSSFSQEKTDLSFVVSGKVINPETKEGISYAHINLDDTYWGIICDSLGFFHIRVNPDQKLKVQALGFKPQLVSINTPENEDEIFQEIVMEKESYMLKQVNVYSLGTWKDFKENFVKTEVPKEENIAESFDFGDLKLAMKSARSMRSGGFGLNLGIFNSGRKKAKGAKLPTPIDQLHEQQLLDKYNRQMVAEITKVDVKKLDQLMKYINSRTHFTYQTSDMMIVSRIRQLYQEFLQDEPNWDYNLSYTDTLNLIPNHLRP